jgi:hypothetical protein
VLALAVVSVVGFVAAAALAALLVAILRAGTVVRAVRTPGDTTPARRNGQPHRRPRHAGFLVVAVLANGIALVLAVASGWLGLGPDHDSAVTLFVPGYVGLGLFAWTTWIVSGGTEGRGADVLAGLALFVLVGIGSCYGLFWPLAAKLG